MQWALSQRGRLPRRRRSDPHPTHLWHPDSDLFGPARRPTTTAHLEDEERVDERPLFQCTSLKSGPSGANVIVVTMNGGWINRFKPQALPSYYLHLSKARMQVLHDD
jgi:hypothetical protein